MTKAKNGAYAKPSQSAVVRLTIPGHETYCWASKEKPWTTTWIRSASKQLHLDAA
jgi:hypothetical protein